jgi:hypothetical protein
MAAYRRRASSTAPDVSAGSTGRDVKTFSSADLYAVFARWGGSRARNKEDIMFVEIRPRANLGSGPSRPPTFTMA